MTAGKDDNVLAFLGRLERGEAAVPEAIRVSPNEVSSSVVAATTSSDFTEDLAEQYHQGSYFVQKPAGMFWEGPYEVGYLRRRVAAGKIGADWVASPDKVLTITVGHVLSQRLASRWVDSHYYQKTIGTCLSVGVTLLPAAAVLCFDSHRTRIFGILCFLAGHGLLLYGIILTAILLFKMWSAIQDGQSSLSPKKAVGFLFVPGVNFFWGFVAIGGWPESYNQFIERNQLPLRPLTSTVFVLHTLLAWAIVLTPLMLLSESPSGGNDRAFFEFIFFLIESALCLLAILVHGAIVFIGTTTINAINARKACEQKWYKSFWTLAPALFPIVGIPVALFCAGFIVMLSRH